MHHPTQHSKVSSGRGVIGPLVKTQNLYLNSGNTSTGLDNQTHYDFSCQLNGLIKCANDEIMRVALVSANVFNSHNQINATNNTIVLRVGGGDPIIVRLSTGNYPYLRLASHLQAMVGSVVPGTRVTYRDVPNAFTFYWGTNEAPVPVEMTLSNGLNVILGFRNNVVPAASIHESDRAAQPHTLTDIVLNIYGVSPILSAPNIDNYSGELDDPDVGHVLAVFAPPEPLRRVEFAPNVPETFGIYVAEKSINTLRIRLTDYNGQPLTWINNQVGVCLQFTTFKRD